MKRKRSEGTPETTKKVKGLKKRGQQIKILSDKKNVSWANDCIEIERKGNKHSTPFPFKARGVQQSEISPTSLVFEDSDSELEEHALSEGVDSFEEETGTTAWKVTPCINACDALDPDNELAAKIHEKLKEANLKPDYADNQDDDTDDESGGFSFPSFTDSSEDEELFDNNFINDKLQLTNCITRHASYENDLELVPDTSNDINVIDSTNAVLNLPTTNKTNGDAILPASLNTSICSETCNLNDSNINEAVDLKISTAEKLATFNKSVLYFTRNNRCIFIIKHPTKLYFHGKLSVSLLFGKIEVLGYIFNESSTDVQVYSPKGSGFLCFEALNHNSNKDLSSIITEFNLPKNQVNKFIGNKKSEASIFIAGNIINSMVQFLAQSIPQQLFPKISNSDRYMKSECRDISHAEYQLQCLFDIEPTSWNIYQKGSQWHEIIQNIQNKVATGCCVFVCGGKGVGKSTYLRYTANQLLGITNRVAFIDLDPGQSEFTVSGCISVTVLEAPIIGPNFTHLRKPERCVFIGDVNILNCMDRYIQSVMELMSFCHEKIDKNIPWLVNYMGLTKSIGVDLVFAIIKIIHPNIVIQIESNDDSFNFPISLSPLIVMNKTSVLLPRNFVHPELNYSLQVMETCNYKKGKMFLEARHIRDICTASYFSSMFDKGKRFEDIPDEIWMKSNARYETKDMASLMPYVVDLSRVILRHVSERDVNIEAVVNGNLVALSTYKETGNVFIEGFGLVRGIDMENKKLYLLTPLPKSSLKNVNYLVMSNSTLPKSFYSRKAELTLGPYVSTMPIDDFSRVPKRSFEPRNLSRKS